MKTLTKTIQITALAVIASLTLMAGTAFAESAMSGDHMKDGDHMMNEKDHHQGEETDFGKPGDPAKVTQTIEITATDFAFDVKEMNFKKGETVKFILTNKGTQDHEITIASAAEQQEHRQMMQEMAGMKMDHNDGNSVSVAPGETKELVWDFTKSGSFEFACNYPGHAEIGMEGKIAVK